MIHMIRGRWSDHKSCINDLKENLSQISFKTKQAIIGDKFEKGRGTGTYAGYIPLNDEDGDLANLQEFKSYGYTNIEIINND